MSRLTPYLKQEFALSDQEELDVFFLQACEEGDLECVHYLLTTPELTLHADIHTDDDDGFVFACKHGHLSLVNYFVQHHYNDIVMTVDQGFLQACAHGHMHVLHLLITESSTFEHITNFSNGLIFACEENHVDVVHFLLTEPLLQNKLSVLVDGNMAFEYACGEGHLDVVKYLLTSPDLNHHVDIHFHDDEGFIAACYKGHLEVVEYLLTSPELTEHADILAQNNCGFRYACEWQHLDTVCYLLSFRGHSYIDFQQTTYNLDWAMTLDRTGGYYILPMMKSLKYNDPVEYYHYLPIIQQYCETNKCLYIYHRLMEYIPSEQKEIIMEESLHF